MGWCERRAAVPVSTKTGRSTPECHSSSTMYLHQRRTGLTAATSAPGLGPPLPHLHRDWAHPCHICTATGLTPATSAPGLELAAATSAPGLGSPLAHLAPGSGRPLPHLHWDRAGTTQRCVGVAGHDSKGRVSLPDVLHSVLPERRKRELVAKLVHHDRRPHSGEQPCAHQCCFVVSATESGGRALVLYGCT